MRLLPLAKHPCVMSPQDYAMATHLSQMGGGTFITSDGEQAHVSGLNQNQLLHQAIDLLTEIRDRLHISSETCVDTNQQDAVGNIVSPIFVIDLEAGDRSGHHLVKRVFEKKDGKWYVTDTVINDEDTP